MPGVQNQSFYPSQRERAPQTRIWRAGWLFTIRTPFAFQKKGLSYADKLKTKLLSRSLDKAGLKSLPTTRKYLCRHKPLLHTVTFLDGCEPGRQCSCVLVAVCNMLYTFAPKVNWPIYSFVLFWRRAFAPNQCNVSAGRFSLNLFTKISNAGQCIFGPLSVSNSVSTFVFCHENTVTVID